MLAAWWIWRPTPPAHPDRIAPIFALLDLDHSGVIEPSEAAQLGGPDLNFEALDLDHSGVLTPGEVEASVWALDPAWWVQGPD
jgi:Ca2+-binding EF-hand superfamily protein